MVLEDVGISREGSLVAPIAGGEGVEVWEFDQHYERRREVLRVRRVHVYLYAYEKDERIKRVRNRRDGGSITYNPINDANGTTDFLRCV
jgi:hypothetical protein